VRRIVSHFVHQITFEQFKVVVLGEQADLNQLVVFRHAEAAKTGESAE
jgi:hypothetical protein